MRETYTETVAKWVYRWWLLKICVGAFLFSIVFLAAFLEAASK